MRVVAALLGLCVASVGCDTCAEVKKQYKIASQQPDEKLAKTMVRERLRRAKDAARRMCGLPDATGLEVTDLTPDPEVGVSKLTVTATPIGGGDAGVDVGKAAVCTGLIIVFFEAAATDDENVVTTWRIKKIEVDQVFTEGHEWSKPRDTSPPAYDD